MTKKILCSIIAAAVICGAFIWNAPAAEQSKIEYGDLDISALPDAGEDFVRVAADGDLELLYKDDGCVIAVRDNAGSKTYYSSAPGLDDEEFSHSSVKIEMSSQLVVSYLNNENVAFSVNSMVGSVNRDTYTLQSADNGMVITFDFSRDKEQFKIPVKYALKDGKFYCELLFDGIEEYGINKILEVRTLPYFGAAKGGKDDYLFVPDGSGAIINLSQEKSWAKTYKQYVYGKDPAVSSYEFSKDGEQVCLPVFGLKAGANGFFGIIEQGAATSFVEAIQPGKQSGFGSVAAGFVYRQIDNMNLLDKDGKTRVVTFVAKHCTDVNPIVSYDFLSGDAAGYVGMAKRYRDHLIKTNNMTKIQSGGKAPIFIDLIGATQKKESFLGFIVNSTLPVTTLEEAGTIVDILREKKVDGINLYLYEFGPKGTGGSVPLSFSIESKLGGKSGLRELEQALEGTGTKIYFGVDLVNISGSRFGWWQFNSAAGSVFTSKIEQYRYKPSTNTIDKNQKLSYYLQPGKIVKAAGKLTGSFDDEYSTGLMFEKTGSVVYSDYQSDFSDRNRTVDYYTQAMAAAAEKNIDTVSDGANAYLFGKVSQVSSVPLFSSGMDLAAGSVPFYAIALHGLVNMSGMPLNSAVDGHQQFLMSILTGVGLRYRLTGQSPVILQDTVLDGIFNSYCGDWYEEIAQNYGEYAGIHAGLQDKFIEDYSDQGDLKVMTYENGVKIIVNFGTQAASYNGTAIEPGKYITVNQ